MELVNHVKVEQYLGMLEYLHFIYTSGGVRPSMGLLWQRRMAGENVVHWRKGD
jgi:hypothetical protein